MRKFLTFLIIWILNSTLLYFSTLGFPLTMVLGTAKLSILAAAIFAGFWVSALVWLTMVLVEKFKIKLAGFSQMFIFYWAVNAAAVWITAHLASVTGFGIASFWWAIGLGLVLNSVCFVVWKVGGFKN